MAAENIQNAKRVDVVGDLDMANEQELIERVRHTVGMAQGSDVVIDLTTVPFIDSSGLRALLQSTRIARDAGVRLRLAVSPGAVTQLFETAGVGSWFDYE